MSAHPRRTTKNSSSPVTLRSASVTVNNTMSLRKGATFHIPPSPTSSTVIVPSLPRRSNTTLEDVVEAHKRRVALTLDDIDRGLSAVDIGSPQSNTQSFRDDSLPVPQGFLNHTVDTRHRDNRSAMSPIASNDDDFTVGGRSLRPRRHTRRPSNHHASDSGLGSSITSQSEKRSAMTGLSDGARSVTASAITRSAAPHLSSFENLPRLSERASNKIHEFILKPLLDNRQLKDFHPIVEDCPRRINEKEIVCLRDLEKTLMFMAPVSDIHSDDPVVRSFAHWFSRRLKERSRTAKLYLDFCLTSIRCIQATVDFLSDREQARPHDRPYTNGYFVDLVDQIKSYAQSVQASKEKEAKGEALDEMDVESYVSPSPILSPQNDMSHSRSLSSTLYKDQNVNKLFDRSDEVKLYGGVAKNGRPAELVRVKKSGVAVSLSTGQRIKMESIEDEERGVMKRSLSEEQDDEESVFRSMARRKRSATAEIAPKRCREPGCTKEFKRSCDLTKHEKTHSRPWKCQEVTCKYHEYGWPTEKELDRHINDKHSASPVLYKCRFPPCTYESKRESNCKQHMEKSHGWNYVRSKNNGKHRNQPGGALPTPQTTHIQTPESENQLTPEDDFDMGYNDHVNFNQDIYATNNLDFSRYNDGFQQYDAAMQMPPFHVSPVESSLHDSSANPSPYLVHGNDFAMNDVDANFGTDFTLYEDLYNANVRVEHFPTPDPSIFGRSLEGYMPPVSGRVESVPHLSPGAQGDMMLFTPASMNAVDETFDQCFQGTNQFGTDFPLFPANDMTSQSGQQNTLFGELPSNMSGFSQSNTQEFLSAFYNANNGTEWAQHDDGYGAYDH
jgi:hypothetical protein